MHQHRIIALAHDADKRLCARRANDQTPAIAQFLLTGANGGNDLVIFQRHTGIKADIFQNLRHRLKHAAQIRDRTLGLFHHCQNLQRGNQPVTRGAEIAHHHMARLLAAQIKAVLAHMLDHIAVAHLRARQAQPAVLQMAFQSQIRHHRGNNARRAQQFATLPITGNQPHQLIAIDHFAVFIADNQPVGIAIQRNADIGFFGPHLIGQCAGIGRTAIFIDVEAVRLHANGHHFRAQFPQRGRGHLIGRAIGTIDNQLNALKAHLAREGALGKFNIARLTVINPLGAPQFTRRHQLAGRCVHQLFNFIFNLIGKLKPVRPEQLNAIIFKFIMRGGNHHANIGAQRARQKRHGGGRDRAKQKHIHAH